MAKRKKPAQISTLFDSGYISDQDQEEPHHTSTKDSSTKAENINEFYTGSPTRSVKRLTRTTDLSLPHTDFDSDYKSDLEDTILIPLMSHALKKHRLNTYGLDKVGNFPIKPLPETVERVTGLKITPPAGGVSVGEDKENKGGVRKDERMKRRQRREKVRVEMAGEVVHESAVQEEEKSEVEIKGKTKSKLKGKSSEKDKNTSMTTTMTKAKNASKDKPKPKPKDPTQLKKNPSSNPKPTSTKSTNKAKTEPKTDNKDPLLSTINPITLPTKIESAQDEDNDDEEAIPSLIVKLKLPTQRAKPAEPDSNGYVSIFGG